MSRASYAEWDCTAEDIRSRVFVGPSIAQCFDRASIFLARMELACEHGKHAYRTSSVWWDQDSDDYSLVVYWDATALPFDFRTGPCSVDE